jgi:hypothetical protein
VPRACAARHGVVPPSTLPRPPRPPRRSRQRPASACCARGAGPAAVLEKIVAGVQPAMLVKTVAEVQPSRRTVALMRKHRLVRSPAAHTVPSDPSSPSPSLCKPRHTSKTPPPRSLSLQAEAYEQA